MRVPPVVLVRTAGTPPPCVLRVWPGSTAPPRARRRSPPALRASSRALGLPPASSAPPAPTAAAPRQPRARSVAWGTIPGRGRARAPRAPTPRPTRCTPPPPRGRRPARSAARRASTCRAGRACPAPWARTRAWGRRRAWPAPMRCRRTPCTLPAPARTAARLRARRGIRSQAAVGVKSAATAPSPRWAASATCARCRPTPSRAAPGPARRRAAPSVGMRVRWATRRTLAATASPPRMTRAAVRRRPSPCRRW